MITDPEDDHRPIQEMTTDHKPRNEGGVFPLNLNPGWGAKIPNLNILPDLKSNCNYRITI